MERVHQACLGIPGYRSADLSLSSDKSSADIIPPGQRLHRRRGGRQEPAVDLRSQFKPTKDSPQVASFPALSYSWLATLARAVEEVRWK
jgi:hypothetical protein